MAWMVRGSNMIFLFSKMSIPAVGPIQPPIQWVLKLTSRLHSVPTLRLSGPMRLHTVCASWGWRGPALLSCSSTCQCNCHHLAGTETSDSAQTRMLGKQVGDPNLCHVGSVEAWKKRQMKQTVC
jgi:hypothetical protein